MNLADIQARETLFYANTFGRLPVAAVRGKGVYLYDINGARYLDFFAGIAVNSIGHCHPQVVKAIREQAGKLIHTSNWLYTLPQIDLAQRLEKLTGMEKCFISNDGTEAVECAIKLARKSTGKSGIIAMEQGFHGRTLGSLSLTWEDKYRKPYLPIVPYMTFAPYNDIKSAEKAITKNTAAVIVEPIQNEAGIIVPDAGYLRALRALTEEKGVLLILDEIATGFGRTGKMFAYQHEKIQPDIICLAKAMGGGFPIGATLYKGMDFEKGQHGGTFVGNPLACAAALASINVITKEHLDKKAAETGDYLMKKLMKDGHAAHGKGLMLGIDVPNGRKTVLDLIKKKILTIHSKNTVRVLPPLTIKKSHCDQFIKALNEVNPNGTKHY
ncbi:MAG: acetylornithine/succinylornithine family transaminase [Candidatus Altiarchaeota archaeon]|nr:acetylornithine/succinylornithine family transaminase [Candidatus Altiarchaeota archaeon]